MRKKLIIIGAVLAVAGMGLWAMLGWLDGLRQADLLKQAQTAYEGGRHDQVAALLQEAVAADPDNLKARQVQAGLLDQLNDPDCISAYEGLAKQQPGDLDAQKAWLGAMVRYGRAEDALAAYAQAAEAGGPLSQTAGFSLLGSKVAEAAGDGQSRLRYLREACRRDPQSGTLTLELAIAELQTSAPDEVGPALDRLHDLLNNPEVQVQAAQLLLEVEAKRSDDTALRETALLIWDRGQSNVALRLLALEAFYKVDSKLFHERLTRLLEQEQRNPQALTQLFDWLLAHGEYTTIIDCATGQETAISISNLHRPPVANRVAEAMIQAGRLEALRQYDEEVNWDGAEGFGALLTPLTRTLDREKARTAPNPAFTRWLRSASLPELRELLPVTQRLEMGEDEVNLLEAIIQQAPWDREAYEQLYQIHRRDRDALSMLKLLQEARDNFPQDRELSNEYAWLSLALNVDRAGAQEIAKLNYSHDPENPSFRETWALALCLSDDPVGALKVLAALKSGSARGQIVKALAERQEGQVAASDATLGELSPEQVLSEERRMVLSSRPLSKNE